MALLTRDQFLALPVRHEDVAVPGGEIRVWELSGGQRLALIEDVPEDDRRKLGHAVAAACCGDESGPFVPPLAVEEFLRIAGPVTDRVVKVAMRLNVASKEAAEEQLGN